MFYGIFSYDSGPCECEILNTLHCISRHDSMKNSPSKFDMLQAIWISHQNFWQKLRRITSILHKSTCQDMAWLFLVMSVTCQLHSKTLVTPQLNSWLSSTIGLFDNVQSDSWMELECHAHFYLRQIISCHILTRWFLWNRKLTHINFWLPTQTAFRKCR